MTSQIALVIDRGFGPSLLNLARRMPVWIVSSEENDRAVAHVRSQLGKDANITSLRLAHGESDGDICARGLYEIDEHHGPFSSAPSYDRVLVLGCTAHVLDPNVMKDLGLGGVHGTFDGFSVDKLVPQVDQPVPSST
jgi:hypothetical protein